VALPVYNGDATIGRAVESILAQTYRDFELLVVNDGSTDATRAIVTSFADPRVRVLDQDNRGIVPSLNRAVVEASGRYIARMDADDVALPERFARQVAFLEAHPAVMVVGSAARVMYADGSERVRRRPLDTRAIRRNIVRVCPFFHSAVMIRREAFDRAGLYDSLHDGSQGRRLVADYDLWVRMLAAGCEMANLPDTLMLYYRTPGSIIRRRSLRKRLIQQTLSRVDAIRRLRLGVTAYANIPPVLALSVLGEFGLKLDRFFNAVSGSSRGARAGAGPGSIPQPVPRRRDP
jgi:glycosyltransferase involved in cell wall biosynthesis